jgi:hypothetical protein
MKNSIEVTDHSDAIRTELPDDMVFKAIPFPLDALVFDAESA